MFAFSHSKTAISFNILSVPFRYFVVTNDTLARLTYINKLLPLPPPPPTLMSWILNEQLSFQFHRHILYHTMRAFFFIMASTAFCNETVKFTYWLWLEAQLKVIVVVPEI